MCIFAIRLGNPTLLSYFQHFAPPPPSRPGRGWLAGGGDSPRPRARGGEVCPGRAHGVATSRAKRATFAARRPRPAEGRMRQRKTREVLVRSAPLARPSASLRGALVGVGGRGTLPHGLRISCVRGGAGWAGLSSVRNAGKGAKRPPKYLKSNWFYK